MSRPNRGISPTKKSKIECCEKKIGGTASSNSKNWDSDFEVFGIAATTGWFDVSLSEKQISGAAETTFLFDEDMHVPGLAENLAGRNSESGMTCPF